MENWKLCKAKERETRMSFDDVGEKKFLRKKNLENNIRRSVFQTLGCS